GGAGFIGSNFIRFLLAHRPTWQILNVDKLTYAGNLENLADLRDHPGYHLVQGDICDRSLMDAVVSSPPGINVVVNFAAETHVDRSLEAPPTFVQTNVVGTQTLLEVARHRGVGRFLHISTDEVYGSLGPKGAFSEESPLSPNSPYAASKAAADLLARAYVHTYRLPVITVRSSNNYGPYQFPEKLIPLFVTSAIADTPLPLYGDGLYVRDWLYVEDQCHALLQILESGRAGEVYNVGGGAEYTNLDVARMIVQELGKPESLITFVADRPGHDRRYALDCRKIRQELGWTPTHTFPDGLQATIRWYVENQGWWRRIQAGEYQEYYRRQYGPRLAAAIRPGG
ncbi:MAG: dTDP-glucose 4,6-dehydratase, partial [Candidatus Methylomirabilales bacterium]